MIRISLPKNLTGSILDIGGGGEGIIGRLYGGQVTAIDNRADELAEAPDTCRKLLMDATALTFPDGSFDHVTCFYTLLYMDTDTQRRALAEAARVLRPGGSLHIWDSPVSSAYPEPFLVELSVDVGGKTVHTTYGIVKQDSQSCESILRLCLAQGLHLAERRETDTAFSLVFEK